MRSCDHPHIVKYFETYKEENECYMVMEHCDGGTLGENLLKYKKSYNFEAKAANYLYQCCLALEHCN